MGVASSNAIKAKMADKDNRHISGLIAADGHVVESEMVYLGTKSKKRGVFCDEK